jgi:hypothetical protein
VAAVVILGVFFAPWALAGFVWMRRALAYSRAVEAASPGLSGGAGPGSGADQGYLWEFRRDDRRRRAAASGSLGADIQRLHQRERQALGWVVLATFAAPPLAMALQWTLDRVAETMDTTVDDAALWLVAAGLGVVVVSVIVGVVARNVRRGGR